MRHLRKMINFKLIDIFTAFIAWFFQVLVRLTPSSLHFIWENIVYFLLRHIFRYRKKVVWKNLEFIFPEQSYSYYNKLEKQFYHFLARMFLEMAESYYMNDKNVLSHIRFANIEIIHDFLNQGKSVIIALGHHNNWIWQVIISEILKCPAYMVYKPLSNKYVDRRVRNSHYAPLASYIDSDSTTKYFLKAVKEKQPSVFIMLADQYPPPSVNSFQVDFLGVKTPFYRGVEFFAKKFNMPVIFGETINIKDSTYETFYDIIYDGSESLEKGEITQRYATSLSDAIKKQPGNYLWSHRRWKKIIKY